MKEIITLKMGMKEESKKEIACIFEAEIHELIKSILTEEDNENISDSLLKISETINKAIVRDITKEMYKKADDDMLKEIKEYEKEIEKIETVEGKIMYTLQKIAETINKE